MQSNKQLQSQCRQDPGAHQQQVLQDCRTDKRQMCTRTLGLFAPTIFTLAFSAHMEHVLCSYLDQIMSYAVFLAKKVHLHLSTFTTGAEVCSSKTSIFYLQRPYSFHLQKPYFFHQFSSSKWSLRPHTYKSYFFYVLRGLGRWILCAL